MALSEEQQTSLLQLIQAMFNATPGAIFLERLGSELTSGQTLSNVAQLLAGNQLFFGKTYDSGLPSEAFASAFIDDLLGSHVSADNKALAIGYIVNRMNNDGATQAEIIAEVTQLLSGFSTTDIHWGAAALAYNTDNATKIVDNLLGDSVADVNKAVAIDLLLAQQASGLSFGETIDWAISALDGINYADPLWGNAAARFDNLIEVSRYYTIEKAGKSTDLAVLQQMLAGVTAENASVITAKTAINDLVNGPGSLTFNLTNLNGSNGFRINGIIGSDDTGESAGNAGDINGDGFDDVIIGAPHNFDNFYAGASFVIFGKAAGFDATVPLLNLNGSDGFRINGVAGGDAAGQFVGSAGDINGDGFDDLLIGAPISDVPVTDTGYTYVVFGKNSGFEAAMNLSSLDGKNGFRMQFNAADQLLGWVASSAGDINGDAIGDIIIGAPVGERSYVVFGKTSDFDASFDLAGLNGSNGFLINGPVAGASAGNSVGAGDINGDGLSDLIIGSYGAGNGTSYIIFGKSTGFDAELGISNLNGTDGFTIEGEAEGDEAGYSVSGAGDVNGDGFDDILIGARSADVTGENSGAGYVVFGKASGFDAIIHLSDLNGSNGFRLTGFKAGDLFGRAVSSAGDFNGDGFDDVIIGAYAADPNGVDSGTSYLIFGKASGFSASLNVSELSDSAGIAINGLAAGDSSGKSVSSAGDINSDGFDDLIIGAPFGDGGAFNSGVGYVIFGSNLFG